VTDVRLRHPDGTLVHVAYGTNVHPRESVDGIIEQMRTYGAGVRAALDVDVLGLGLWLPAAAAAELASRPSEVDRVREALARHGLEIVTVNAFPYARFHADVVKKDVYRPDWSEQARLEYTLDCARVLGRLMPDDAARGSISTLPLGWRSPWYTDRDSAARDNLGRLGDGLAEIAADVGRPVQVAVEPEPGCVIETTAQAVERLAGVDTELIGVCLDTCHLATGFEDVHEALRRLDDAGLPVVKLQASAAVHVERPADDDSRAALRRYAEDRFLHQVRESAGSRVTGRDDLDEALDGDRPLPGRSPWRVHFHVPVHAELEAPLASTRAELADALHLLVAGAHPRVDHVEVETYTWDVLPAGRRPEDDAGLVAGLADELRWVRDRLSQMQMEAA
jgi:sugar phosphate isomerase/epimerase